MANPTGIPQLLQELDGNLTNVASRFSALSREQFNWNPVPRLWSIGQNIAHLNIVNAGDLESLRSAIASGFVRGLQGSGPFKQDFLGSKIVGTMEPPVKQKVKAPKAYHPPLNLDLNETLVEYKRVSVELRKLVESAEGLDLSKVRTQVPFLPAPLRALYRMPLATRFSLIAAHDRRHIWVSEQLMAHPDFPR